MSTNPQWKNFQSPDPMQDASIIDFKSVTTNGKHCNSVENSMNTITICELILKFVIGKSSQAFNFSNRSTTNSRYGPDFPLLPDKSSTSPYNSSLYGSSSTTHTTSRFPIGTFTLDSNNVYNSSGDNNMGNSVFSNGNSNSYNSDSNSANLGTRETGIIEKLLVRWLFFLVYVF